MKLSKIELYGFKSFARRTEFEFDSGITTVVGPNGCGKSNLVDALRWALGEQRPKLLRCSTMPDVLYRGGATQVDAAEVTLTFDNEDGTLPVETPEVQITRRLTRDGVSEYKINERAVRLRDVRELLLDTGLGVGGYSFMEQGRIDYILNASALERRMLVEEAAGTSRYRLRRKEALRKLERTQLDLDRAGDMISELERRVRSLKVQAGRARNFMEKRERLQRIMQVAYVRRLRELEGALGETLVARELASQQELECREELAQAESALSEREQRERSLSVEVADARTEMVERRARAQLLSSRREDLGRRTQTLEGEKKGCEERAAQLQDQLGKLRVDLEAAERARDALRESEQRARDSGEGLQIELERAQQSEADIDLRGERLQDELLHVVEEQQRVRDLAADLESELRALVSRRDKLDERVQEVLSESRDLRGKARSGRDAWRDLGRERQGLESELSANDEELSRLYTRRQGLAEEFEKDSASTATDRSKLAVLEDAITRHEGVDEQVRSLLERAGRGEEGLGSILGILADMITASSEAAVAVESALGPWAEALVVPDRAAAIEVLRVLRREGAHRVRILSLAELLSSRDGHSPRTALLDGAQMEETSRRMLPALLSRFDLLPPDVPLDLCSPRPGRAIVSGDGEMMLNGFETMSRARPDRVGLITRRTERDQLAIIVGKAETRLAKLRGELGDVAEQIASRERDREAKAREREGVAAREREAMQVFRVSMERLKLLREELGLDRREAEELEGRRLSLTTEKGSLEGRREEHERSRVELHARREGLQDERQRALESRQEVERRVSALALEVARLGERIEAAHQGVNATATRLREREDEWRHLDTRREEIRQSELSVEEELAATAGELERLSEERVVSERQLAERTAALDEHQGETRGLRETVTRLRSELESASDQRQELELKEQERRLHVEGLGVRIREDLEAEPAQVSAALDGGRFFVAPPPADAVDGEVAEDREADPALGPVFQGQGPVPATSSPLPGEEADQDHRDDHAGVEATVEQGLPVETAGEDGEDDAGVGATVEQGRSSPVEADGEGEQEELEDGPDREEIDALLDTDLDELQREVDTLKGSLQRLGPVNLEAIDELDEVEGRAQFFVEQREDLTEARRSLKNMIEEIDRECEERFAATFEAVRDQFRVLFRRLFRGGRADLILLDADDPSDAGVDIVAAPPGKDPRSIAMLSGGERTLTATGILFALFSTRPSPFCVLDEVDAALDEANIERFTSMVRDFLDRTQFVIVTHNKRTMAAADRMYGVTMEGDGVSRPIAMQFHDDEAGPDGRARQFAKTQNGSDPPGRARGAGA